MVYKACNCRASASNSGDAMRTGKTQKKSGIKLKRKKRNAVVAQIQENKKNRHGGGITPCLLVGRVERGERCTIKTRLNDDEGVCILTHS